MEADERQHANTFRGRYGQSLLSVNIKTYGITYQDQQHPHKLKTNEEKSKLRVATDASSISDHVFCDDPSEGCE